MELIYSHAEFIPHKMHEKGRKSLLILRVPVSSQESSLKNKSHLFYLQTNNMRSLISGHIFKRQANQLN